MVLRSLPVGTDDQGTTAVRRHRPFRDGGLLERGLPVASADELSGPTVLSISRVLGNPAPRKSQRSIAAFDSTMDAEAAATVRMNNNEDLVVFYIIALVYI